MNGLRKFLAGRHGVDQLSIVLFIAYVAVGVISQIFGITLLYYLSFAIFGYALFRMLSRNHSRRTAENTRFLYGWYNFKNGFKYKWQQIRERKDYRYLKCPHCNQTVRVPRGKGKVAITCPKCKTRFVRKV